MKTKHTILDRELFTHALRHMGEEDLLYINSMVVERLNLLAQAKSTAQRLNKKTVSLVTDDAQQWKVSPGLLRKSTP